MTNPTRTVFLGTGTFAVPILSALAGHPAVDLVCAITAPPRTGSRGKPNDPPVATWAVEHDIPLLRPVRLRSDESLADMRALGPDLLVLADYGQIVPAALLDLPRHGALNLHPSLLPRHRGATPIPAAILAGDAQTGVTLMRMDAGLDSGPIVAQARVPLTGTETGPELEQQLAGEAARLLVATLGAWLTGEIAAEPQPEVGATLTRPLRREDGRVDVTQTAAAIERQVRAYQPWPGSFVEVDGSRIVVWRAHPVGEPASVPSVDGLYRLPNGGLALRVADGGLALDEVQPGGGRRMSGAELVRGRPGLIGARISARAEAQT